MIRYIKQPHEIAPDAISLEIRRLEQQLAAAQANTDAVIAEVLDA